MNGILDIMSARADLINRGLPTRPYLDYVRRHHLDILHIGGFCGAFAVTRIVAFDGGMFDFAADDDPDGFDGAVCEAIDRDGETTIDLVAWPLDQPDTVLSMYRRAPLLGMWQAMSPYTYSFGSPLILHRHPLDWLKASCDGAAIVTPHLAARALLDLPGRFAPQDRDHAREVDRLFVNLRKDRMVIPRERRIAA